MKTQAGVLASQGERTCLDSELPRYDWRKSYDWNYENGPGPVDIELDAVPGQWRFCGLPVESPLGIPAGPLLNSRWLLYYASLGFDVLVYKTVRSSHRVCYPVPNLQPIRWSAQMKGSERGLPTENEMTGSWAVSFGMPSKAPNIWQADVELARKKLSAGKVLCVSVVGSVQSGWTIDDLAGDYAKCARRAVDSGADAVELNFSCPNVSTCDGQLYLDFASSKLVAAAVRSTISSTPLIIKIGHVTSVELAQQLLDAVSEHVDALAMTNSIAATVASPEGQLLFDGQKRAICGTVIRDSSVEQVRMFSRLVAERKSQLALIGVGGASDESDVQQYLSAGAQSVHIATAAMRDPALALRIRRKMSAD